MFLIAPFRIRRETMNTIKGSNVMKPIFIGRWTPKVLFSLQEKPYQPRIFRIDRQKRDQLKTSCCRIFIDPAGEDNHRSASRYVPLGRAIPHEGKRWRAPSRNLTRTYPGVAGSRNSCSKNKLNKPGGQYEYRKQNNLDHRRQPWHRPGTRRRSTQTRRATIVMELAPISFQRKPASSLTLSPV